MTTYNRRIYLIPAAYGVTIMFISAREMYLDVYNEQTRIRTLKS